MPATLWQQIRLVRSMNSRIGHSMSLTLGNHNCKGKRRAGMFYADIDLIMRIRSVRKYDTEEPQSRYLRSEKEIGKNVFRGLAVKLI